MKLSEVDCRKVCYTKLLGHCQKHTTCPYARISNANSSNANSSIELNPIDTAVLIAIMGEQEEFDDGSGANALLQEYLEGNVQVIINHIIAHTADGKEYRETIASVRGV